MDDNTLPGSPALWAGSFTFGSKKGPEMKKKGNPLRQVTSDGSVKSIGKGFSKDERYVLRLYVSGMTQRSMNAIRNIRKICDERLKDRCDLQVIDIYKQPVLAKGEQIIATPTLIKQLPPPLRKFIGDLTNTERILVGLDLVRK